MGKLSNACTPVRQRTREQLDGLLAGCRADIAVWDNEGERIEPSDMADHATAIFDYLNRVREVTESYAELVEHAENPSRGITDNEMLAAAEHALYVTTLADQVMWAARCCTVPAAHER